MSMFSALPLEEIKELRRQLTGNVRAAPAMQQRPPVSSGSQISKLLADEAAAVRVSVTAFRKGRGDALDKRSLVLVFRVARRRPALLLVAWQGKLKCDDEEM